MPNDYFGKETETLQKVVNGKKVKVKWNWANFESTKGYPVDDNLISWVIGQDRALQECFLCLDEWAHKLEWLEKTKWYDDWKDPKKNKPAAKSKLSPGPYLLLLGDPGTGKSLIGRALAEKLTQIYKKNNLKLFDVLCWKNDLLPSEPQISMDEAGKGKETLKSEKLKEFKRKFLTRTGFKILQILLISLGMLLLFMGFYFMFDAWQNWIANPLYLGEPLQEYFDYNFVDYFIKQITGFVPMTFVPGGGLVFFGVFM